MVREEEMPADNPSPPTASPPKGGDDMMLKTPMVWMDSEVGITSRAAENKNKHVFMVMQTMGLKNRCCGTIKWYEAWQFHWFYFTPINMLFSIGFGKPLCTINLEFLWAFRLTVFNCCYFPGNGGHLPRNANEHEQGHALGKVRRQCCS